MSSHAPTSSAPSSPPGYEGKSSSDGKREGYGVQKFKNGDEFKGTWHNDKPHGRGIYTYANGAVYDGNFHNGLRHGDKGTYTFAAGDTYVGTWDRGQRTGKGRLTVVARGREEGYVYEGEFREGKKHGVGALTYTESGDVYKGEFRNDAREGQGTLNMRSNGDVFTGKFEGDTPHGYGQFYRAKEDALFRVFFLKGELSQQVCGEDSMDSCQFNRKGVCVKCARPKLALLLQEEVEEEEQASRGLSSVTSRSPSTGTSNAAVEEIQHNLPQTTQQAIKRAHQLLQGKTAFLGVMIGEARGFVRILEVKVNSTAWQIGLHRGQYLLSVNGIGVSTTDEVAEICAKMEIGDEGVLILSERNDPPRLVDREGAEGGQVIAPQNATPLGFRIGGNLHAKEVEFLHRVSQVTQPVSEKTLENLDRVHLRDDPVCFPEGFVPSATSPAPTSPSASTRRAPHPSSPPHSRAHSPDGSVNSRRRPSPVQQQQSPAPRQPPQQHQLPRPQQQQTTSLDGNAVIIPAEGDTRRDSTPPVRRLDDTQVSGKPEVTAQPPRSSPPKPLTTPSQQQQPTPSVSTRPSSGASHPPTASHRQSSAPAQQNPQKDAETISSKPPPPQQPSSTAAAALAKARAMRAANQKRSQELAEAERRAQMPERPTSATRKR